MRQFRIIAAKMEHCFADMVNIKQFTIKMELFKKNERILRRLYRSLFSKHRN